MTIVQIKNYMKNNKITYQMLSDRTGLSLGRLKDIFRNEDSNPTLATYNKIITALGIDESDISTGINDMSDISAKDLEPKTNQIVARGRSGKKVEYNLNENEMQAVLTILEGMKKDKK